ncbi:acyltransferase [Cryptosporidium sp. chipmunk genotype I]|uniref:acyltransferase n=1 Tax=Cryptosporidium sp. chipmunk genotype I TaxID=1280935 RepID=UPI00351A4AFC|nr:acyltransferase [Cryptosporidium sp. chipmunk genotype I]
MQDNKNLASLICLESSIVGNVELGEGCIVHPSALIDGGVGGIIIGKNNIIEESVKIVNKTINKMSIGNNNWFHVRCEIDSALTIGDNNSFEVGSRVNKNTKVGSNCLISLNSGLPPNLEICDNMSVAIVGDSLMYTLSNSPPNQYLDEQINFLNNILRGSSMEKKR